MPVGRLPAAAGRDSSGGQTAVGDGGEGELDSRGKTIVGRTRWSGRARLLWGDFNGAGMVE